MSEMIEIAGHKLEVEEYGRGQRAVYDSCFSKGNDITDFQGFADRNPKVIVTAPYNIITIDGADFNQEEHEDVLEAVKAHIESGISGDVSYDALAFGFDGDIVLTGNEISITQDIEDDVFLLIEGDFIEGGLGEREYEVTTRAGLREELVAELEQMQDHERAGKILDLLKYSVDPEDLPEFAVSRDRTKAFSGEVATSVDPERDVAAVVSPNGRFVVLNDDEAQGLNDADEVELSRKNVNEDFTVTVLDKDREQELGR
jgi:hypothetical protein